MYVLRHAHALMCEIVAERPSLVRTLSDRSGAYIKRFMNTNSSPASEKEPTTPRNDTTPRSSIDAGQRNTPIRSVHVSVLADTIPTSPPLSPSSSVHSSTPPPSPLSNSAHQRYVSSPNVQPYSPNRKGGSGIIRPFERHPASAAAANSASSGGVPPLLT